MELLNATKMVAGYTLGMEPSGRESLVVAVKGTFVIPADGGVPDLAEEQAPLVMADEFTGEPGLSATLYETDFAPHKPRCDVLLNGSAYAPGGKPTKRVTVGLAVGSMRKALDVVGDRVWDKGLVSISPTPPQPFVRTPISYDRAFGGTDVAEDDPDKRDAYLKNPVGVGYYPLSKGKALVGKRLPNTQEVGKAVDATKGNYRPMSLGPVGRNFESRIALAGTYDDDWLDKVFPFLPADFDPLYHQAAPPDQQIDHPRGGEEVLLINLTPQGRTRFRLPATGMSVEFTNTSYERTDMDAILDTIIIEPDLGRLMLVWRASIPLKKNIFEITQGVVGCMPRAWYRARRTGKTYYPSLDDVVAAQREEA